MNMQKLYNEMKNAITFLGLRFHEMDKIQTTIPEAGWIKFSYENKYIAFKLEE